MAASLKLLPGSTVRWRGRRYLIVDYESLDAIIARQPGKRRLERIPVNEAAPDHASHIVSAWTPDLASVPEEAWQKAVKRFKILKPLLNMGNSERTFAHIKKAARALGKHPATVYRWIEDYGRSERLSVFLRKERSDRGARRLSNKVEKIIDAAIKKIYLTAERPDVAAVVEEVNLSASTARLKESPHRGNRPDPRVRYSHGNRRRQRCPALQGSLERPAAQSSSSCRPCRQEPVWQSAFAQARHASGTQL
jgi:putative transposase